MSIAINEDHVALADTVAAFLTQRGSLTEARARLDGAPEALPDFWGELAGLGWLGLHLGEDVGGSGFGLEELVVVAEQTGRALMPGPFLPTVIASAAVQSAGTDEQRARLLPGLADGSVTAAVALDGDVTVADGKASGFVRTAVGAGIADLLLVPVGSDVVVVTLRDSGPAADPVAGVSIEVPDNLDPSRRSGRVTLDGAPAETVAGGAGALVDSARLLFSAEAVGIARECTEQAAEYAKERQQFGRPIAMFQAVKHHCANMLVATELAFGGEVEAYPFLEPHGSLGALLATLGERPELEVVVIAGHEPFLSGAASLLLGLRVSGFPTAGAFHIELARLEPDAGSLLWRWVHGGIVR